MINMAIKLNVLLAKTDHLAAVFKNAKADYIRFFKTNQGAFKGEKKTYEPALNQLDDPKQRGNKLVVTTVSEKLQWLTENSKEYIDALFAQEATNASGIAKAKLTVDGIEFGVFSSLELLRLKSIIEEGTFKEMYENLPVRNDDEIWKKTKNESYTGREIYESSFQEGIAKTTIKESYILDDPNIKTGATNYHPQVAHRDIPTELGKYSFQKFSGEATHLERASILQRRSKLLSAVLEALKEANDAEAVESQMTSDKLFNYLHTGKI